MGNIELKDLIYIEKILTDEQCDALIQEREDRNLESATEECLNALTGILTQSTFEQVELLPDTDNFRIVHDASEVVIKNWLKYLKTFDAFSVKAQRDYTLFSHKYRLMRYKEGQWIHPHIDWSPVCMGSLTISLNDEADYEGGDFVFFNRHKVRLRKGEAMVFPANPFFVHEVQPITKNTRYSVNSFLEMLNFKDGRYLNTQIRNRIEEYKNMTPQPWQYDLGE